MERVRALQSIHNNNIFVQKTKTSPQKQNASYQMVLHRQKEIEYLTVPSAQEVNINGQQRIMQVLHYAKHTINRDRNRVKRKNELANSRIPTKAKKAHEW